MNIMIAGGNLLIARLGLLETGAPSCDVIEAWVVRTARRHGAREARPTAEAIGCGGSVRTVVAVPVGWLNVRLESWWLVADEGVDIPERRHLHVVEQDAQTRPRWRFGV